MIENIHSHEGEEQKTNQAAYTFKPPKNIKQIGESTSSKKIYVEDYVFTYIKELVKKEYADCRIAVLLGHYIKMKDTRIILINGAVEAEGTQFDAEAVFNNDTWTSIYENIKRYFNDVEVVGWCIGGPGFILENDDKLKKIHLDNFAGVDKTLLKYDSIEGEEAFYIYEHGTLSKQSGYYIYYEKNDDMQNYIIEHKSYTPRMIKEQEENTVKEFKNKRKAQITRENDKSMLHLMYAAGSLMVVIVIVVFAAMINNSNKINNLEKVVSELSATLFAGESSKQGNTQVAEQPSVGADPSLELETISGSLNSIKDEDVIGDKASEQGVSDGKETKDEQDTKATAAPEKETQKETTSTSEEKQTKEETESNSEDEKAEEPKETSQPSTEQKAETKPAKDTQVKETSGNVSEVKYYEVQKGDTLVGISFKLYHSGDYVTKIMELNGIEDMDMIFYGQKLIVP